MEWTIRNIMLMPWRGLWSFVWDFCEWQHIRLGRFAPFVFNQSIVSSGAKKCKVPTGKDDNK